MTADDDWDEQDGNPLRGVIIAFLIELACLLGVVLAICLVWAVFL